MCGPSIHKELEFWGLDENSISPCCWKAYSSYEDEKKTVLELAKTLGLGAALASFKLGRTEDDSSSKGSEDERKSFRDKTWKFLEKPQSSKAAKVGKHPIPMQSSAKRDYQHVESQQITREL